MKKLLALLLALSMVLTFAACRESEDTTPDAGASTPSSGSTSSTGSTESTGSSEGTSLPPETTAPPASEAPATQPPATTPPATAGHTHNYTSNVTTATTCTANGVKTFSCSCGDSYTEAITATGHTWGNWQTEAYALVGKAGTEKRTCSACSISETKERTANAISNSFYDGGLIRILNHSYGTIDTTSLLEYASREFHEYADKPVAAATIYAALARRFDISNYFETPLSTPMQNRFGYDAANDTYTLHDYGDTATLVLLGYVHQGGNRYDTYYAFTPDGIDVTLNFKVALEYNKLGGNPNRYLSIERASELPADMISCADGEQSEYIG